MAKTNKAWEPEVGERYWHIGNGLYGNITDGCMVCWDKIRRHKDAPYNNRKRNNNVFRTRAQAREALKAIKYIMECCHRCPDLTGMAKWRVGNNRGVVMVEFTDRKTIEREAR